MTVILIIIISSLLYHAGVQLLEWVGDVIRTDGIKATEGMNKFEPHVMAAYMVISSVEDARAESAELDRVKQGEQ